MLHSDDDYTIVVVYYDTCVTRFMVQATGKQFSLEGIYFDFS